MFSLIITLIAIALVAALALATLYYGGPVFNEGAERALAAKLDAQGQQIMGALELYNAEMGHYPAVLEDLVSTNYLKAIPTAAAEQAALAAAYAATGTWSLSSPGKPVIVMKPVSLATCQAFNKSNLGTSGVLKQAHSTVLKQCIGTDINNLMIIQPKSATDLVYVSTDPSAVVQIGEVLSSPIPQASDKSTNGWLDTAAPVAHATVSANLLSFPSTDVGSSATPQSLTITNTGTANLVFAQVPALASAPFSISGSTCNGASLAPTQTCTIDVGFTPPAEGVYSGATYQLQLQGATASLGVVSLQGTGRVVAVNLSAADCLVQHPNHTNLVGLLTTFESASALFNQCERPIMVKILDNQWSPEFALAYGYQVSRYPSEWLPGAWFGWGNSGGVLESSSVLTQEIEDSLWIPSAGKGELVVQVWMHWYNSENMELVQNISSALNSQQFIPFKVTVQDLAYASGVYVPTNSKVVQVKFQDEPDTAFTPKTLVLTGAY